MFHSAVLVHEAVREVRKVVMIRETSDRWSKLLFVFTSVFL